MGARPAWLPFLGVGDGPARVDRYRYQCARRDVCVPRVPGAQKEEGSIESNQPAILDWPCICVFVCVSIVGQTVDTVESVDQRVGGGLPKWLRHRRQVNGSALAQRPDTFEIERAAWRAAMLAGGVSLRKPGRALCSWKCYAPPLLQPLLGGSPPFFVGWSGAGGPGLRDAFGLRRGRPTSTTKQSDGRREYPRRPSSASASSFDACD